MNSIELWYRNFSEEQKKGLHLEERLDIGKIEYTTFHYFFKDVYFIELLLLFL